MASRLVFPALCALFFLIIGGAAAWEWSRFARGESALSPRHLRWRLLSALVWLVVLGSLAYATFHLPQRGAPIDKDLMRRLSIVLAGSLFLLMLAFAMMALDIFWTVQVGRKGALKRARQSQDTLQREIERVQIQTENSNGTG